MSEHTPGPWRLADSDVVNANGDLIAAVYSGGYTRNGAVDDARLHANARLIAAAPDVVAAGQRLLAVFDQQRMTTAERIIAGVSDAGLRTEGNAAIDALRAAIAKATNPPIS